MRVFELALAAALALTAPTTARADPVGSKTEPVGAAPGVVQVSDSNGLGWHAMCGGWHHVPGHLGQWNRAAPPHWVAAGLIGGWACCTEPGVLTYWVWGPTGGAFDYPFADWRGPTARWGNPWCECVHPSGKIETNCPPEGFNHKCLAINYL